MGVSVDGIGTAVDAVAADVVMIFVAPVVAMVALLA
jgi:hypothetical protein